MSEIVVLAPAFPYRDVARAFERAGWSGGPVTVLAPLVPGEPEAATWRQAGTVVRYSCDPVMWLRVLRIQGDQQVPDLPRLSPADVELLLASDDETERLLGAEVAAILTGGPDAVRP